MITFQQGTKLIIDNGTDQYELLVSSATASQTYIGSSRSIRTLHAPDLVDETFSTEKGTVNLTFSCSLIADLVLMEWFGFTKNVDRHEINTSNISATGYTIYLWAGGTIYRVSNCIAENMSFTLSKASVLQVNVTGVGANLDIVPNIPVTGSMITQGIPYSGSISIPGYDRLSTVSCEITRSINWVGAQSIFDVGSIFTKHTPIIDTLSITGTITQNKSNDLDTEYNYSTPISISYGSTFKINLQSCSSTSRWDMANIHKRVTDYKLQPTISGSYIQF